METMTLERPQTLGSPLNIGLSIYGPKRDGHPCPPNPTQKIITQWVNSIRAKPFQDQDHIPVLYIQGGNGAGKTRGLTMPAIKMLTQINGIRLLWGRYDFKDLKLSVMDKFFEIIPHELFSAKNEQYHYYDIRQPQHGTGRIYFNGLKDLGGLGSQEFAVIIITEVHECSHQIYTTLKRRCRQANMPCMILMESEPPGSSHWLNDLTDPDAGDGYDSDVEKIELSSYENWANLPPAYRGSLESMPEAAKRKYILGKSGFSVEGKPFYQGFDFKTHAGEFEPVEGKPIDVGWDFGFHFPAVVITQDDPKDRWVWLREKLGRDITIQKFGEQVIKLLNDFYPGCPSRHWGDPASDQVNDKSERTSKQILAEMGIQVVTRQSTYRERKEIMERKLRTYNDSRPQILVDRRHCPIACDGFMGGYRYPTKKEASEYNDDKMEVPYRDGYFEHIMNAAEYIMVNRFKAVESHVAKTRHPRGRV